MTRVGSYGVVKTHYTGPTRDVNLCNYRRLFFVYNLLSSDPGPWGLVFFRLFVRPFRNGHRAYDVCGQRYCTTRVTESGVSLSQPKTLKN